VRKDKLRRHIAIEAARLMYERVESEYFTAKRKAAARLGVDSHRNPQNLPSNREIRDQIQSFARIHEGDARLDDMRRMRLAALRMMRLLAAFEPRLIGSVLTGHVRAGSDIDLHVFAGAAATVVNVLEQSGYECLVEHKQVIKHNERRLFTHIHVTSDFNYEFTVYALNKVNYPFKSSITGKLVERANIEQLERLILSAHPNADLSLEAPQAAFDPYLVWSLLLPPLEKVKQDARWHPEGDALYHSLQAFEIARREHPYDIEMIACALLHDVGKAIDPHDHVDAGLEALEGTLSERETFLIAHHMDAHAYRDGTLGAKLRRRLVESEWFEDLMVLNDIDERARETGAVVCSLDEALAFLRALDESET
jgi:predicted nucleotidyltransferase